LRWLKKGLPSVTAPDGRIAHGGDTDADGKVDEAAERQEEDDAMGDIGKSTSTPAPGQEGPIIPPLDQEQEYEWKWRVSPVPVFVRERVLIEIAKDGSFEENFLFVITLHFLTVYLPGCFLFACIQMYCQHSSTLLN
jgi:hypothetical protein